ncbi:MAG TPA: family 10 glycosylhydrolase [Vicinamibacteria bacterium]|nr:family 10 glycosylhydrolase [Vicinamibacteria bacterium]
MRRSLPARLVVCAVLAAALSSALAAEAADPPSAQYRAFWVDTFNTNLSDHADVRAVVDNARAARANAIFAQVRRRGDSWYLDSLEGPAEIVALAKPLAPGFDPLADLITEAHAAGIEVHAFVIAAAIWNRHPTILAPPAWPDHPFNRHGFNQATGALFTGRDNWLTRTLIPDGTAGVTFQGTRIGAEFWVDFGHPDAAAYTADVLTHLVERYDVDGLHLDRIRYPEISIAGQTPTSGTSIGYNETSVARFNQHYGRTAGTNPAQNDPLWNQWRRDQVTNVVRRIYLGATAVNPRIKISGALIAFGGGPTTEASWNSAEAYWRVYQDWRAWTEEGILDIAAPMAYKAEHTATIRPQWDQWSEWTKNHAYNRSTILGQGGLVNAIEGSLRQARRSFTPSAAGNFTSGLIFYSMATSNIAVANNPFSIPPGQSTPVRSFAEFASALTTGRSVDGTRAYEDLAANPVPVFPSDASVPDMPWKSGPVAGHLMGFVRDGTGAIVDTGAVTIARESGADPPAATRTTIVGATDGGGFYGGVDLAPGTYRVTVTPVGQPAYTTACVTDVIAGQVRRFDVTIDREAPTVVLGASPRELWPPNHRTVDVTLAGAAEDAGTGIDSVSFRVLDEYGLVQPEVAPIAGGGLPRVDFSQAIPLEATRAGKDKNGRTYTLEVTVTDRACQARTAAVTVVVPHDQGH